MEQDEKDASPYLQRPAQLYKPDSFLSCES